MIISLTLRDIGEELEARIETTEELGGDSLAEMHMGDIVEFLLSRSISCSVYEMGSSIH